MGKLRAKINLRLFDRFGLIWGGVAATVLCAIFLSPGAAAAEQRFSQLQSLEIGGFLLEHLRYGALIIGQQIVNGREGLQLSINLAGSTLSYCQTKRRFNAYVYSGHITALAGISQTQENSIEQLTIEPHSLAVVARVADTSVLAMGGMDWLRKGAPIQITNTDQLDLTSSGDNGKLLLLVNGPSISPPIITFKGDPGSHDFKTGLKGKTVLTADLASCETSLLKSTFVFSGNTKRSQQVWLNDFVVQAEINEVSGTVHVTNANARISGGRLSITPQQAHLANGATIVGLRQIRAKNFTANAVISKNNIEIGDLTSHSFAAYNSPVDTVNSMNSKSDSSLFIEGSDRHITISQLQALFESLPQAGARAYVSTVDNGPGSGIQIEKAEHLKIGSDAPSYGLLTIQSNIDDAPFYIALMDFPPLAATDDGVAPLLELALDPKYNDPFRWELVMRASDSTGKSFYVFAQRSDVAEYCLSKFILLNKGLAPRVFVSKTVDARYIAGNWCKV